MRPALGWMLNMLNICLLLGTKKLGRAKTRWLLLYTLLNNPSLQAIRKRKINSHYLGWQQNSSFWSVPQLKENHAKGIFHVAPYGASATISSYNHLRFVVSVLCFPKPPWDVAETWLETFFFEPSQSNSASSPCGWRAALFQRCRLTGKHHQRVLPNSVLACRLSNQALFSASPHCAFSFLLFMASGSPLLASFWEHQGLDCHLVRWPNKGSAHATGGLVPAGFGPPPNASNPSGIVSKWKRLSSLCGEKRRVFSCC